MSSNIDKYNKDLEKLIKDGGDLLNSMYLVVSPDSFEESLKKAFKTEQERVDFKKSLPRFNDNYQAWYSESLAVIKQLLPDRLNDFIRLFEKPKTRKTISYENYVVEDFLQGLTVTRTQGWEKEVVVDKSAAIPKFEQQFNILKSVKKRLVSSLFDIKQLVQADLFDSELEVSEELNKKGFVRGAGAIAGVVLEAHLAQVCENHNIRVTKKDPSISDLNNLLKADNVIETPNWRFIQRLGDLRNKCDHKKQTDPNKEEIDELIEGVKKISKSIF